MDFVLKGRGGKFIHLPLKGTPQEENKSGLKIYTMNQEYNEFVKNHGMYLKEKLGVNEWAFSRNDAFQLLEIMRKDQQACLGGDVLVENEGKLTYDYTNWYYNQDTNETQEQYVENSILKAEEYIKNYPEKEGKKYYYVLV